MYAIIEVGAKQYNVKKGDILEVEKQAGEKGKDIKLGKVLLVYKDKKIEVGRPYVSSAAVLATILRQTKARKAVSFKYRRRKSSHWRKGHRQQLTRVKVKEIEFGS